MKRRKIIGLLENVSAKELENLIASKKRLDVLEDKRKTLERELASVSRQIDSLEHSISPKMARKAARKSVKRPRRKRIRQPSVPSLIVEILKEKKRPMKINDIHEALLKEKNYKTRAKNFKTNVRIVLYKKERGLFKKVGPGKFTLAKS